LTAAPLFDVALDKTPIQSRFALILSGFLLGGIPIVLPYMANLKGFGEILANVRELSPEARRILAVGDSGTYARLGQNDDLGHAVGLGNWKLACPLFHQYPFLPKAILDDALNCASKTPVLILAASLRQETVFQWNESFSMTQWNDFVSRAESLAKEFDCDSASGLRVCKRRP
jgi:hypothetical protein